MQMFNHGSAFYRIAPNLAHNLGVRFWPMRATGSAVRILLIRRIVCRSGLLYQRCVSGRTPELTHASLATPHSLHRCGRTCRAQGHVDTLNLGEELLLTRAWIVELSIPGPGLEKGTVSAYEHAFQDRKSVV